MYLRSVLLIFTVTNKDVKNMSEISVGTLDGFIVQNYKY
jgi:hypothetical protein